MGFFGWIYDNFLMSEEEEQRRARVAAREREMKAHWAEYRPKLEEARERWANTQKEMYKTTGLIMVPGADSGASDAGSIDDRAEFEDTKDELTNESENLQEDIETYKADKADAISHYANPE